ncbi:PepSY-like domain-containing protein [Roseivirga sp.]|uniref:PepSY-like domain-containing protein n=1 Tax=Roseivirga sp. TaxID=1964215 RepID=UPI002B279AB8|nr:PepSY-like domain-containing protein [Roseivirga sp.]
MLKKILIMSFSLALITACQDDEISSDINDVTVTEISTESLPNTVQTYISENFVGEVAASAFKVTSAESTNFEVFLTNSMNLVFSQNGDLEEFGEDVSQVDCEGRPQRRGKHQRKGDRPEGDRPTQLQVADLPATAADYLTTNYPDSTVLKVIFIDNADISQYHVLVKEVGALVFDVDGNFVELKVRQEGICRQFDEVAIEDLAEAIRTYITNNYPDNEVLGARIGERDGVVEIHVLVKEVGALIFDEDGNFVELKTCGMKRG